MGMLGDGGCSDSVEMCGKGASGKTNSEDTENRIQLRTTRAHRLDISQSVLPVKATETSEGGNFCRPQTHENL